MQVARSVGEHHVSARIVTGSLRLARELRDEYGYALIEGRNEANCQRHDVVRALGDAGHDVESLACGTSGKPRCPFRSSCGYWLQFQQSGVRVGATEQLFNSHFLIGGSLAIVDDADLGRTLVESHALTADDLGQTHKLLKGKRRAALRRLLTILGHAILEAPCSEDGIPEYVTGAAVWDRFAWSARLYAFDFVELTENLPKAPSLPTPAAGADGVVTREAVENAPPPKLLRLFRALQDEVPYFLSGQDFNSRLRLSRNGIEVRRLKEHISDRYGQPLIAQMDLLVLDATPVGRLVDHLMRHHERLPEVATVVRLPENIRVIQYAISTNGHTVLKNDTRVQDVMAEIASERQRWPVDDATKEGAVCFRRLKKALVETGFKEEQIVTFGSVRGTNALAAVERLHVVGRPMPPGAELPYLAQVIYFGESSVSDQILLRPEAYGGQPYAVDVVDFADARVAALLRAAREDEILQAIQRGRLFALDSAQLRLVAGDAPKARHEARLVLHTSQPVPGLKVDELVLKAVQSDVNAERRAEARARIKAAIYRLQEFAVPLTDAVIAREAGADRRTVAKVRREPVDTLKKDLLNKGLHILPKTSKADLPQPPLTLESAPETLYAAPPNLCRGGCGKPMPDGQMCFECAVRKTREDISRPKKKKVG